MNPSDRKNILFISYDGMTDPLGQSQILPYVSGLSKMGYRFTLLSCEKKNRFQKYRSIIEDKCKLHRIDWQTVFFHKRPPILAKFYDIYQLKQKALKLYKEKNFDLIHCRSYIAIEIGLWLKKKFGVKVLFDMRGFWVDERVDGGLWNKEIFLFRWAYKYYKNKEAQFIQNSDHIIVLTEAGKKELMSWPSYKKSVPVTVVSCSADFEWFTLSDHDQKQKAREKLNIPSSSLVVSYLGSLGTWYMLDEMLDFFKELKKTYPDAKFLMLTPDDKNIVYTAIYKFNLKAEDFILSFAMREDVPYLSKAADFSLSFIKPAYSKIASSPTKIGELLAMGIPVVSNKSIGDVEQMMKETSAGIILEGFDQLSYQRVVTALPEILAKNPEEIRNKSRKYYDLNEALNTYEYSYRLILES
ncbi:MAG: hypothetical protein JWO58_2692 [Chitinophagaceae bacterium]|nr:hypothetical protein [Chitinophagaceae bacterium]